VTAQATIPAVFLPYQQQWVADQSTVKVVEKSRRVGITWAEAADDVLIAATSREDGGQNVWYIGYNQDMARDFVDTCAGWARQFDRACSDVYQDVLKGEGKDGDDIQIYVIKFASGCHVKALASRPSNLRGKQGVVVIDEAAFHDDLPGLLKSAMALLMWGGRVRIISTHDGESNPFNGLVDDVRAGRKKWGLHRITFDLAVEQGLYRRICLAKGAEWTTGGEAIWCADIRGHYGEDAAEELDVIPSQGSGTFLTRMMIEGIMRPDIPVLNLTLAAGFEQLPEHIRRAEVNDWCAEHLKTRLAALNPILKSYFGQDFGRTADSTTVWPVQESLNLTLHTPFLLEMRNVPFAQQKQVLFYLVDRLPRFTAGAMDARGNGGEMAEATMQRYGAGRIEQVMATVGWYREHMPRVKAAVEDRTITAPRHDDVLADLRAIKRIDGVAQIPKKREKGADGNRRHGEFAISLANVLYAVAMMEPPEIDYTPCPQTASPFRDRLADEDEDRNNQPALVKGGGW